ncbi:MAG: hypothetical protein AVDCRST_MAG16-976, partial [uncultured Frankineae bacterium]
DAGRGRHRGPPGVPAAHPGGALEGAAGSLLRRARAVHRPAARRAVPGLAGGPALQGHGAVRRADAVRARPRPAGRAGPRGAVGQRRPRARDAGDAAGHAAVRGGHRARQARRGVGHRPGLPRPDLPVGGVRHDAERRAVRAGRGRRPGDGAAARHRLRGVAAAVGDPVADDDVRGAGLPDGLRADHRHADRLRPGHRDDDGAVHPDLRQRLQRPARGQRLRGRRGVVRDDPRPHRPHLVAAGAQPLRRAGRRRPAAAAGAATGAARPGGVHRPGPRPRPARPDRPDGEGPAGPAVGRGRRRPRRARSVGGARAAPRPRGVAHGTGGERPARGRCAPADRAPAAHPEPHPAARAAGGL